MSSNITIWNITIGLWRGSIVLFQKRCENHIWARYLRRGIYYLPILSVRWIAQWLWYVVFYVGNTDAGIRGTRTYEFRFLCEAASHHCYFQSVESPVGDTLSNAQGMTSVFIIFVVSIKIIFVFTSLHLYIFTSLVQNWSDAV